MSTIIISDLHLGNRHCHVAELAAFIESLPATCTLVLNGDVVDRRRMHLSAEHTRVLDLLRTRSQRQTVVWVRGNHDRRYEPPEPHGFAFCEEYADERQLFVAHGHGFDTIMPFSRPILAVLRNLHRLWVRLGGDEIHVAQFAKRVPWLYDILRHRVRTRAIAHARREGFTAVTSGHTHYPEDSVVDGVRYLNTGAWTELPAYCIAVEGDAIRLVAVAGEGAT